MDFRDRPAERVARPAKRATRPADHHQSPPADVPIVRPARRPTDDVPIVRPARRPADVPVRPRLVPQAEVPRPEVPRRRREDQDGDDGGPGTTLATAYRVEPPGGRAYRATPKVLPVTLDVVAPSHGQVRISGLARFFPAHTIHADRATAVVDGNDCRLRQIDHYHVNRVELSLDRVTETRAARDALRELLARPDDRQRIRAYQRALARVVGEPDGRGPTEASLQVRTNRVVAASHSAAVVRADGSRVTVNNRYVVEETVLPAVEMLARDADLVRLFAHAVLEPEAGEWTARFLRAALRAGGRVDELALLDHATGLPRQRTNLFNLFGAARVTDAATVMVGERNTHEVVTRVDRVAPRERGILADLAELRTFAPAPVVPQPVEEPSAEAALRRAALWTRPRAHDLPDDHGLRGYPIEHGREIGPSIGL